MLTLATYKPLFNPFLIKSFRLISLSVLLGITLSACLTKQAPRIEEPTNQVVKIEEPNLSATRILKPSKNDVRFAQTALLEVGYQIGAVDGIWGKRSSTAIKSFEASNALLSAGGGLSELNLHNLETISGLLRQSFHTKPVQRLSQRVVLKSIDDLLNKDIALSKSAQLVILEKQYQTFSKPNPYSSKLFKLFPGTGIYIISKQDGWYKIETLEEQIGFVKVES